MPTFNEATVEDAALDYLREIGYSTEFGPNIGPGGVAEQRASWEQVYLLARLRAAARRINPEYAGLVDDAIARLQRAESQSELLENFRVHTLLVDGVPVEFRGPDGQVRTAYVRLIDFETPSNNDWLAVNQFTIVGNKNRRPDVLVFVNGIPLGLLELKNPANEHATLKNAWNQVQTYRTDIPAVFTPNAVTVISDGTSAAMSSFSGGFEHYAPWKTVDGR
ncbi:MAG TPA: type I restriction endonuclease, partial [Actinomycetota bacterium]|nr:type I restriction endonuclease [Actinomycetota bacterium]